MTAAFFPPPLAQVGEFFSQVHPAFIIGVVVVALILLSKYLFH